jgi:hypothetical protein
MADSCSEVMRRVVETGVPPAGLARSAVLVKSNETKSLSHLRAPGIDPFDRQASGQSAPHYPRVLERRVRGVFGRTSQGRLALSRIGSGNFHNVTGIRPDATKLGGGVINGEPSLVSYYNGEPSLVSYYANPRAGAEPAISPLLNASTKMCSGEPPSKAGARHPLSFCLACCRIRLRFGSTQARSANASLCDATSARRQAERPA